MPPTPVHSPAANTPAPRWPATHPPLSRPPALACRRGILARPRCRYSAVGHTHRRGDRRQSTGRCPLWRHAHFAHTCVAGASLTYASSRYGVRQRPARIRAACSSLAGVRTSERAKRPTDAARSLLDQRDDVRALQTRRRGSGPQQRTAAGDHNALACHWRAALDQRLQPARARDAWQGPARKRQKALTCAGRDDQFAIADRQRAPSRSASRRCAPIAPARRARRSTTPRSDAHASVIEQGARRSGRRMPRPLPPDLTARQRVIVDDAYRCAMRRRGLRGAESGRPGADHRARRNSSCRPPVTDRHTCCTDRLAGEPMTYAVDRDPALLAHTHPAERPAQFAADRAARHDHRMPCERWR